MSDRAAPASLGDLLQGEHTLIWAFRSIAFGAGGCPLLRRQFEDICGPAAGTEAFNALSVFVRELGLHGRRKITLHVPGSFRLSRDEQLILAAFAAAQDEDYERLEAHLAWLIASEPSGVFGAAACLVAQAMAMNDLRLRAPQVTSAPLRPALNFDNDVVIPFPATA